MALQSAKDSLPHGLVRWYMDMRELTKTSPFLPQLTTLQQEDQKTVKAFYHLADRHMSLASYLLKYLYIHRACRVPWNKIIISRTPAPHKRPCYLPLPPNGSEENLMQVPVTNIEFNVSHQASLVALSGCQIPGDQVVNSTGPSPSPSDTPTNPQVGIDITCTDERSRRGKDSMPTTESDFRAFIDIYTEVFSSQEISIMKSHPILPNAQSLTLESSIQYRLRRFYAYWALKEAYIKMTGEALLASWLRELEFFDVNPPEPAMNGEQPIWGSPEKGVQIWLHGQKVENVRIELVAFGREYLIATATRGGSDSPSGKEMEWEDFKLIDLNTDIAACSEGRCLCLI